MSRDLFSETRAESDGRINSRASPLSAPNVFWHFDAEGGHTAPEDPLLLLQDNEDTPPLPPPNVPRLCLQVGRWDGG